MVDEILAAQPDGKPPKPVSVVDLGNGWLESRVTIENVWRYLEAGLPFYARSGPKDERHVIFDLDEDDISEASGNQDRDPVPEGEFRNRDFAGAIAYMYDVGDTIFSIHRVIRGTADRSDRECLLGHDLADDDLQEKALVELCGPHWGETDEDGLPKHIRIDDSLRYKVMQRDGFQCRLCNNAGDGASLRVDLELPRSEGGRYLMSNLRTLCTTCDRDSRLPV